MSPDRMKGEPDSCYRANAREGMRNTLKERRADRTGWGDVRMTAALHGPKASLVLDAQFVTFGGDFRKKL
jgi:hypothetical protein